MIGFVLTKGLRLVSHTWHTMLLGLLLYIEICFLLCSLFNNGSGYFFLPLEVMRDPKQNFNVTSLLLILAVLKVV